MMLRRVIRGRLWTGAPRHRAVQSQSQVELSGLTLSKLLRNKGIDKDAKYVLVTNINELEEALDKEMKSEIEFTQLNQGEKKKPKVKKIEKINLALQLGPPLWSTRTKLQ
jgi:DMSO/TMAO reductase YedYZ molybdopterin-dependent catalytic subunit